jgi:hypothetical protein
MGVLQPGADHRDPLKVALSYRPQRVLSEEGAADLPSDVEGLGQRRVGAE